MAKAFIRPHRHLRRETVPRRVDRRTDAVENLESSSTWRLTTRNTRKRFRFVSISVPEHAAPPGQAPSVCVVATIPGYFSASGIRLATGRDFTAADDSGTEPVALVNTAFEKRFFGGRAALGRTLGAMLRGSAFTSVRVVGVGGDVKYQDLRDVPERAVSRHVVFGAARGAHR